ncbi:MAG: DNA-binding response regulator [Methylophilaceae bacterium]|nr:MAG: DNA-binding response regulator [Methylophilaceae bacterium]
MPDLLKILIADDEAPARNRLKDLLEEVANVSVVAEAKNGKQAIELAIEKLPDLMLLDIRMPLMDGLEAAEHAQKLEPKPHIIFTTAYDAYAIRAFDLNAIDYLLKPIRLERLLAAIEKVRALTPQSVEALKSLQKTRSHLSIHERDRVILVPIEDIIYLRAELKYITVRTREHEYLLEESLTNLETELAETFLRLHRNCLVAKQYISSYEKRADEKGDLHWHAILKDVPDTIAISRRQQHLIRKA